MVRLPGGSLERVQSIYFSQAGARRVEAARVATQSGQWALADMLLFDRWLDAELTGNQVLADLYQRRFRPDFLPAFEAWKRLDPVRNPEANAGPLTLPEYQPRFAREAQALEVEAERLFDKGKRANATSDIYVQTTVLLALVLFFMGVAPRFDVMKVRIAMTGFGALVLVLAIVRIFTLPVAS